MTYQELTAGMRKALAEGDIPRWQRLFLARTALTRT